MGWALLFLLAVGVVIYKLSRRKLSPSPSRRPPTTAQRQAPSPEPPRPAAPPAKTLTTSRAPASTRERAAAREPAPWSSKGREIPFAAPGLAGPLFRYGGTSVRGGVEHIGPYAVIDFETTGLSPQRDRIVEIAIARVDASGRVEDEFATLVNPVGRDVGPTFIHGITNDQVRNAPTFAEVAPDLLSRMSGAVVVAHNATFEEAFLAAELKRIGVATAPIPALCTLFLSRQTFATPNHKLGTLARAAGVPLIDKHAALGDVRAVSALLPLMTSKLRAPLLYGAPSCSWPSPSPSLARLVTRAVALRKGTDGWMQSLIARLPSSGLAPDDAAGQAYLDALADALADGKLTGDETKVLAHLAGSAGMGSEQVLSLNQRFLDELKVTALDDDILTVTEIRELRTAAKALSLPEYFAELTPTSPSRSEPTPRSTPAAGSLTNSTSMEARSERGIQALAMQRAGSSRAEIGTALGLSQDTVKAVLRDAKFYENPESDPSRLALAREAQAARRAGSTRDRFQSDSQLTSGKSTEAWRDAAMLSKLI